MAKNGTKRTARNCYKRGAYTARVHDEYHKIVRLATGKKKRGLKQATEGLQFYLGELEPVVTKRDVKLIRSIRKDIPGMVRALKAQKWGVATEVRDRLSDLSRNVQRSCNVW